MPSIPGFRRLTQRQRGALALVVGTALLLSPLYVTAFHLDSRSYTYLTAPVTVEDGQLVFEGVEDRPSTRVGNLGCTSDLEESRACALDRYIHEHGPIPAPRNDSYLLGNVRYTRVDGQYYKRVERERNGTTYLALEPVPARMVLDDIAISESGLTWPGRVALFTGRVTTTYPLEHGGYIVDTGDRYQLVYLTSYQRASGTDWVLMLVGVVAGLWLLGRGYRTLPRG